MMNLSEFLGNWDGNTLVYIETHIDKVFLEKSQMCQRRWRVGIVFRRLV